MKPLFILLISGCLITTYCTAQPLGNTASDKGIVKKPSPVNLVEVTFITDDTCNLTIDNKDYKEFAKNKIVNLPLRNYKLLFESLETGKIIRDRIFRLTRDKVTGGKYKYSVTFKQ